MVIGTFGQETVQHGIRRLDPLRDLAQVAGIIEAGFGRELTPSGRRALREMRFTSRLGPLLWWMAATSPEFREYHSGFVWVQDGQIVGTLHITRPGPRMRRWFISNVAVRAEYRGRGIARALMETALHWAREQDSDALFLRVRKDNVAAFSLYQSLGFERLYDAVDLELAQVPPVKKPTATDQVSITPYRPGQWPQVRQLARAAIPPDLRWLEPVRAAEFEITLSRRISEWWARLIFEREVYRLVAEHDKRIIAAAAVKIACRRGVHTMTLHVQPEYRGKVEERLVAKMLAHLWPHRDRMTRIALPIAHDQTIKMLKRYGFEEQKTLTLMHKSSR